MPVSSLCTHAALMSLADRLIYQIGRDLDGATKQA